MVLLDAVPITSCHECVAMLTLPLALFLLLAETAVGGFATVAYLRLTGGLTHGFLKFIAVTYAILGGLAFLVVLAGPPGSYHRLLSINQSAAGALIFLQGLVVVALIAHAVAIWRQDSSTVSWALTLSASVLLVAGIATALWPLSGSLLNGAAIALVVVLSAAVLGAATTGMLLGHWYLVTPALTNRPLLRAIGVLLVSLVLQAIIVPVDPARPGPRLRITDASVDAEPRPLRALGAGRRPSTADRGGAGLADLPAPVVHVHHGPALPGDDRHPSRPAARPAALFRGRLRLIARLPL